MQAVNYIKIAHGYIDDVISVRKITGKLEFLAVKRHLSDLEYAPELGIYFEEKAARKAFAFFSLLKHSKGEFAGKTFILSPWQAFIVYCLFGWHRADGSRRFRYAYIEVARKNGKTTFAAAIALLMMIFDGEEGAEVYTAATKRDQAKICWTEAKNMVQKSPALKKYVDSYQRTLVMESTLSKMEPLSRDSDKLDGLNPHMAICDELHAWKTDDLFNVLKSATGARRQPLIFSITTAGFNKDYPCFSMRKTYIEILEGVKDQLNTFVVIFTLDENDDWKDSKNWPKANPNIDISVSSGYLDEEFQSALNRGGTEEVNFKTKNLNVWVDAPTVWIPDEKVSACDHGITKDQLIGQECFSGLDLASHVDINALAHFFPNVNGWPVVKLDFWVPESKITEREDRVDYMRWKIDGHMQSTPGDLIDTDWIVDGIIKSTKKYKCMGLGYDPYKAHGGIVQGLDKGGLSSLLIQVSQSIKELSEPTKELEKMVVGGIIDLMNNPVLRWMFRNVVIYRDPNDNVKLDKSKSQDKIDGVVATVIAIAVWMAYMANQKNKIASWQPRSLPTL
jgi:phage terminase large subunit-like protein